MINFLVTGQLGIFTLLEFTLGVVVLILIPLLIVTYSSKRKKYSLQTVNFLDFLPFENNPEILAENIVKTVLKKYDFSTGSYLMVNTPKKKLYTFTKERVPQTYLDDIKNKVLQSLIECGVDKSIEKTTIEFQTDPVVDNQVKRLLSDSLQIPIVVNEVLIGVICFTTSSYFKTSDFDIFELYAGINKRFDGVSKFFEEVQEGKDKFEDLINSMNSPVCMIGKSFDLIYLNPSFQNLFKLRSTSDFNILDFSKKLPEEIKIEKTLQDVFINGKLLSYENVKLGNNIYDIHFFPVIKANKVGATSILFQEVSREFQEEKLKQEFVAMLVHDLRSPVTSIKSGTDLILSRFQELGDKKIKEILKINITTAEKMLSIISDLLDAYKIDLNKIQVYKEVVDINQLVEAAISEFDAQAQAKSLELKAVLDPKSREIAVDKMKISQVLQNLISNSVKYTDKGSIKVITKFDKKNLNIDVVDTGSGISDELKGSIFDKFTQLENSLKGKSKGTGLGLSVVKGIVQAHQGEVKVLDNKPGGTIFRVILPIV